MPYSFAAITVGMLLIAAQTMPESSVPPTYPCFFTPTPITIDGRIDDPAWQRAAWTTDFIDITGVAVKKPPLRTRMKMLWDDKYLYIAAELDEPDVHASLMKHDAVIFHDNDFEIFLKPLPLGESYYEFELNALNTGWDLFLDKPYRLGGKADSAWEATGLKTAVDIQGSLNDDSDKDRGWTLEIAFPLSSFASRQQVPAPVDGTKWRANFSRVEWTHGKPREDNWVWASQGAVNMHIPEKWGTIIFRKPSGS